MHVGSRTRGSVRRELRAHRGIGSSPRLSDLLIRTTSHLADQRDHLLALVFITPMALLAVEASGTGETFAALGFDRFADTISGALTAVAVTWGTSWFSRYASCAPSPPARRRSARSSAPTAPATHSRPRGGRHGSSCSTRAPGTYTSLFVHAVITGPVDPFSEGRRIQEPTDSGQPRSDGHLNKSDLSLRAANHQSSIDRLLCRDHSAKTRLGRQFPQ